SLRPRPLLLRSASATEPPGFDGIGSVVICSPHTNEPLHTTSSPRQQHSQQWLTNKLYRFIRLTPMRSLQATKRSPSHLVASIHFDRESNESLAPKHSLFGCLLEPECGYRYQYTK